MRIIVKALTAGTLLLLLLALHGSSAGHQPNKWKTIFQRRLDMAPAVIATTALATSSLFTTLPAYAGVDPAELKSIVASSPSSSGGGGDLMEKVKQLQNIQDTLDAEDIEFTPLSLGASYREFRSGRGDRTVMPNSWVCAEITIRCKSFSTAKEPGGVKYFDSKIDAGDGVLAWRIGDGSMSPALEEALMGMKRGAVRRIELPSTVVFDARKNNQLPLPNEKNQDGVRRFAKLFKTDATLIFEVLIDTIKEA